VVTWRIFGPWLALVLVFYPTWGRRHALLNDPEHQHTGFGLHDHDGH